MEKKPLPPVRFAKPDFSNIALIYWIRSYLQFHFYKRIGIKYDKDIDEIHKTCLTNLHKWKLKMNGGMQGWERLGAPYFKFESQFDDEVIVRSEEPELD